MEPYLTQGPGMGPGPGPGIGVGPAGYGVPPPGMMPPYQHPHVVPLGPPTPHFNPGYIY